MDKKAVVTAGAPEAVGPYSQAIKYGNLLFVSGQIPINPGDGTVPGSVEEQTEQVLKNLEAILRAGGSSLEKVLKATVFITDMNNFMVVNEIYARYFPGTPPARACVQVSALPKGVQVEIEAIAAIE